ncbi:hypothetical protein [Rhodococcus sp. LB1]|uniref:hypothetical protein n=1 Tax=Rhodococcus sp. LB1 TaxID=1807499 RepID=UPI00077B0D2B|nr:hypothetical protein [Rhodococcus sp. LB1]KXX58404.1 hypothetical protein AZG88_45900 [Rhodococcus sp. LB1]
MSLYIVSDHGQDQWLAYVDTENPGVYAYVANLGRFVFHKPLGQDFYWDRELDWTPVDTQTARKSITDGVIGKLDGRRHSDLLAKLDAETDQRSVEDVFGAQPVDDLNPSPQQQAEAKLKALASTRPGEWLTWKVYDRGRRQLASVAARDLRTGKVAAVRKSGLHINSRVTPTADGRIAVEIARTAEAI